MTEGYRETGRFTAAALKKGKRCRVCGKHLKKGTTAVVVMGVETKYYPTKGLMGFHKVQAECVEHNHD